MASAQSVAITSSSKHPANNNPRGINQYKHCRQYAHNGRPFFFLTWKVYLSEITLVRYPAPPDDLRVPELLRGYHREGITDKKRLSQLFRDEHGIIISDSTVGRRRRDLGLRASGRTTAELPDAEKRQLVLNQMAKDSEGKIGAATVKTRIFKETGIDITRDWIRKEMRRLAPEAFEARRPHKKASSSSTLSRKRTTPSSRPSHSNSTSAILEPGQIDAVQTHVPGLGRDTRHPDKDVENLPSDPHNSSDYENDSFQLHHDEHFLVNPTNPHSQYLDPNLGPTPPVPPLPTVQLQDMLTETIPKMVGLTQLLRTLAPEQGPLDAATSATALQCMEAAALLERELARVASSSR